MKLDIVLFGASRLGDIAYHLLCNKFNILYYCDNNEYKVGKSLNGIKIISTADLMGIKDPNIIITSSFETEISNQLFGLGYKSFNIFTYCLKDNSFELKSAEINNRNYCNNFNSIDNIEGWLSKTEQTFLMNLPSLVRHVHGDIIEIGSYKGKSSVCLALGCKLFVQEKKIYCIDPFISTELEVYNSNKPYFSEFIGNIRDFDVEDFIIPVMKESGEAASYCPNVISAIFIDGDHSYNGLKNDIKNYANKVATGGIIAFHDYPNEIGVKQAVQELCVDSGFELIFDFDLIRVLKKR